MQKNDYPMRFLYKYYSNFNFVLDTIINKRLYFSSPNDFNDPFDCRPKFSLIRCKNDNIEDWRDFLSILAKEEYPGISDDESLEHAEAALIKGLHHDNEWLLKSEHYDSQVHNYRIKKNPHMLFYQNAQKSDDVGSLRQ